MAWWDDDELDLAASNNREDMEQVAEAFAGLKGSGWVRTYCPMCERKTGKPDKKGSLGYNSHTGGYNCFKCGSTGQLPINMREELPFTSADVSAVLEMEPVEIAGGYVPVFEEPGLSSEICEPARRYLLDKRGLDEQTCFEARLGTGVWGKLMGRVIVPIFDYDDPDGRPWLGWVSRDYTGFAERPYLYPRAMKRDRLLYNEPCLYVETEQPVFVVEGTLDALALWPDAVAVLGKPLDGQLAKLKAARRPIAVCLDGDAWEEGWALSMKLRMSGLRAGNIRLPPKRDPDEMDRGWLNEEAIRCLSV